MLHLFISCRNIFTSLNLCHVFRCEIATREYCAFMHGYFHEDATLCSQVQGICMCVRACVRVYITTLTSMLMDTLVFCRSTVWMMCVACYPSSTLTFQISFTASGSPSSSTLGKRWLCTWTKSDSSSRQSFLFSKRLHWPQQAARCPRPECQFKASTLSTLAVPPLKHRQ